VSFLGAPAQLPIGPWVLASTLRVPVFLGFGIYRGGNRYDCHFELFAERIDLPRADRDAALQRYAQQFADRLEHYARLAPYNWFNFYDFWH
jgi:predicted LPLAT superfamily acyltransferase